jgi:hypothetical protein
MNITARTEKLDLKICVSFVDKLVETSAGIINP